MNLTGTKVNAPLLDGGGEFLQESVGLRPVDAGVGDALSIDKRLAVYERLRSSNEIALNHDTHDAGFPIDDLFRHGTAYRALPAMIFAAVCMAAVNHDAGFYARPFHLLDSRSDGGGIVVGDLTSTAQDDVAVRVTGGKEDGGLSRFCGAQEGMRMACRQDGFNRNLHVAGGSVLEADRTGKAGGELAVDLTLGGSRADCPPAYEVGDVLGGDHVEEFSAGGYAHLGQIEEQAACDAQSVADAEGFVEVRIVDQALPAEGGARLLEIDTHDDHEIAGKLGDRFFQKFRIFPGRNRVVDRARAYHDDQAIVRPVENVHNLMPCLEDSARRVLCDGQFLFKENWRKDDSTGFDPEVVCGIRHGYSTRILGMAGKNFMGTPLPPPKTPVFCYSFISLRLG